MKILQLCDVRWYNANAHYVLTLSRALHASGHGVHLWLRRGTPLVDKARRAGLPVTEHRGVNPRSLWRLGKLVGREGIQLLNVHRGPDLQAAMLLQKILPRPVVVTRSDIRPFRNNYFNRNWLRRRVGAVIVSAGFYLEPGRLADFTLPREKIHVVPLGIDHLPVAPQRESPHPFRLVLTGRFDPVKGHRIALEALQLVQKQLPETRLTLVGHGANISVGEMRRLAAGIPGVTIIAQRLENLDALLQEHHAGLVTSLASEAVVRSGLEYFRNGLPLVGSRINAVPDLLQKGGGFLVPPGNPAALAQALLQLHAEYPQRSAEVLRIREEFRTERMLQKTLEIYREVLSCYPSP